MTSEKKQKSLDQEIELIEGVTLDYAEGTFTFKGPKGDNSRKLVNPGIVVEVVGNKIALKPKKRASKKENKMINTFVSHINNLMKGVSEGFTYKLKICSGHFPMNVSVSGNELVVKNFIGEKIPRKIQIKEGTTVKVEGTDIIVESVDKELAGHMAASIEQLTRRPGFDSRIFQDGIYIVEKDGKELK